MFPAPVDGLQDDGSRKHPSRIVPDKDVDTAAPEADAGKDFTLDSDDDHEPRQGLHLTWMNRSIRA